MTSIAPYVQQELAAGGPRDQAVTRGVEKAIQAGAFTGLGFASFEAMAPVRALIANAFLQTVQPGVEAAEAGKPVLPAVQEALPGAVAAGAIPAATHLAGVALRGRGEAPPGAERPAGVPPPVRTPEEIENQDGVGPEAAQRIHDAEAARQPAAAAATTVPAERADAAARKDLAAQISPGQAAAQKQLADTLAASQQRKPTAPPAAPVEQAAAPAPTLPAPQPIAPPDFIPGWKPPTLGDERTVPGVAPIPELQSGAYVMLRPDQLTVDPERFQYKESGERGVTGALAGVNRWEPALANPITAWQDNNGQIFVVNGHQRTDLANRAVAAGQPDVQVPTRIFREADGYTPDYMRALGAYQNIAEGSGTAIDAAKVLRAAGGLPGDRQLPELPPRQQMVRDARGLAALSDQAFGAVENGVVAPAFAARVGERIADPIEQLAAIDALARAQPANAEQARFMVEDIRNSGFLRGNQTTLFGDEAFAQSLIAERAKVLDHAMRVLRRQRGVFKAAVEGEETLTTAGNVLNAEANVRGRTENERLLDTLSREATTRGPISDALSDAARDIASGKPISGSASRFLANARRIIQRGENEGVRPSDIAGGEEPTEAGRVEDANQAAIFERKPPLPPQSGAPLLGVPEREQAASMQRAPTIRTDTRQVDMFGRSDAAVQAQAARDQAGRGALLPGVEQKAADEGLFARKETPQPELPTAPPVKSQWKTHKDMLADVPPHTPENVHQVAADWVFQKGRETGHEHFAVVDNATGRITSAGTSGKSSRISLDLKDLDATPDRSVTFYHNHPQSSSFSVDDLMMAAHRAISHMVAIGHDGTVYTASVTKLARAATSGPMNFMRQAYNSAYNRTKLALQGGVNRGQIVADEGNRSFYDMAARLLAARGFINYVSSHNPTDTVRGIIRSTIEGMGVKSDVASRFTQSVRSDEAVAGLPRGVAGEARGEGARAGPPTEARPAGARGTQQGRLLEPPAGVAEGRSQREELALAARERLGLARRAVDEIKQIFAPTSRSAGARQIEQKIRKSSAEIAQSAAQSTDALQKFGHMVGRLPEAEQYAITDRREAGQNQPTPELNTVIGALRNELATWAQKVRSLGPEYLKQLRENYMAHIWANHPEWSAARDVEDTAAAQAHGMSLEEARMRSKGPLKGSANFLKRRVFDTQREGMEAGLIPITSNPIEMNLIKLYEMQRFYHGVKLADDIKNSGLAHWIPYTDEGAARASGYVKLDDSAFQPRVTEPGEYGRKEYGNWYAPEPVARVFNNYVSKGLAGHSAIYDAIRGAGNALNSAQLSFSGFHATFIAFDTMMSKVALGIKQLAAGEPIRGIGTMARGLSPSTIFSTVAAGSKLRDAYLHPETASPEMRKLVRALTVGGGRVAMDNFYRSTAAGSFIKNMGDLKNPSGVLHDAWQMAKDTPIAAPLRIAGRIIDTLNEPLMGQLVPRAKLGVFSDLAADFMRRNPEATDEQFATAMTKAWDSIDNRMGQLVYDNLFWNKTAKDLAFITTRSVGWNLGSLREIGGGVADSAKFVADVARLRRPEVTNRMAYVMAMTAITGLYGGILNYLMTGEAPQQALDYFYPRTGAADITSGAPGRTTLPGYIKDVMAFKNDPLGTVGNKMQPLFETSIELAKNRDYYGGIINMPGVDNPMVSYPEYIMNQAIPFSWRGWMKTREEGAPMLTQALNFFGIQPAPQSIVNPAKGERYQERIDIRALRARQRENAKGRISFGGPP
jgi:hypothetical protein